MLEVIFIRHGQSEANMDDVIVSYQGDPGLTAEGWAEARRAAQVFDLEPLTAIYASPLRRTRETASAFQRVGIDVQVDDRLHEIALGRWDGMTIDAILGADRERYQQWKDNPELGAPDGGEALSAVATRLASFLDDVRRRHPEGRIIATTHSDCLKALLLWVLRAPWTSAKWYHLHNTAGLSVEWHSSHWQVRGYPLMPPK